MSEDRRVARYMRSHAVTVTAATTVREAVDAFDLYRQAVLPVVGADGAYTGAVTLAAVLDRLVSARTGRGRGAGPDGLIGDLVQPTHPSVGYDEPLVTAEQVLLEARAEAVVVTRDGFVVGLLGLPELCSAAVELADAEASRL